jgi:hypothetical protein
MSLALSFKPGMQQAYAAFGYLSDLASELVSVFIADMDPRQYLVGNASQGGLALRIWSTRPMEESEVLELLPWIHSLDRDLHVLAQGPAEVDKVHEVVQKWTTLRHGVSAFFVEVLHPEQAFSPEEQLRLSIGVIGGTSVMISAPSVMYVEQGPGLFGLSLAGQGSYLIEQLEGARHQHERVRRA